MNSIFAFLNMFILFVILDLFVDDFANETSFLARQRNFYYVVFLCLSNNSYWLKKRFSLA